MGLARTGATVAERLGFLRVVGDFFRGPAKDMVAGAVRSGTEAAREGLRSGLRGLERGKEFTSRVLTRDPIDVATGEVVLRQVDADLEAVLPLVVERTHLSSYRAGRLFGASWASTLDQRLEAGAGGVWFAAEDGTVPAFPAPAPGETVETADGPLRTLSRSADGAYALADPRSGRTWHFPSPDGPANGDTVRTLPIGAVTDRNGNRIDFVRDADGTLRELRHSGGYRIGVEVAAGRVRALRLLTADTGGRASGVDLVRYGYDDAGRLTEVTDSSGEPLRFTYDDAGRLSGWLDRNGGRYGYEYDEHGRGVRGRGSGGFLDATLAYDTARRVTTVTDSLGNTTAYHLDGAGHVVAEADPLGHETRREWDRRDRLLAETDPLGNTTRYEYDSAGNLTAVVRPDGRRIVARHDDLGLPVEVVQADGATWRYAYDRRGNLLAVTDPLGATTRRTYDERGALTSVTDALGNRTLIRPNPAGLPVEVTGADGGTTRYERDAFGRVVSRADQAGGRTRWRWSAEGRLLERVLPGGATERWAYDAEGNQIEHVDAAGRVTRTEYANFDVPTARTGPDGGRLEFTLDTELRVTAVTDAAGLVWRYEYDAAGRLVRETDFDGRAVAYRHDAAGRLVERVNGAGQVIRYTRDRLGDVVRRAAGDQVTAFTRDAAGRLVRAVDAGADLRLDRDAAGRIVAETCDGRVLSSVFDALGRRVARRTPTGAVSEWAYDPMHRPVALRTAGQVLRFGYDAAGREVRRHIGDGAILDQRWDAGDRLVSQTLWGAPVTAGRVTAGAAPPAGTRPGDALPDAAGGVIPGLPGEVGPGLPGDAVPGSPGGMVPGGAVPGIPGVAGGAVPGVPGGAGAAGPDRVAVPGPGGARLLQHRAYRYRPDGHVTGVHDRLSGERRFDLDPAGRITAAVHASGWAERYAYDPAGNLTSAEWPAPGGMPVPDEAGERLVTGTRVRRAGRTEYVYDGQGRVVTRRRRTLSGKVLTWRYTWDAGDRLVAVTGPGGHWRYRYDPLGRRIAKQRLAAGGDTVVEQVDFTWDGTVLAEQVHTRPGPDGGRTSRTTTWNHEPGTFRPLTQAERTPVRDAPQEWIDRRFHAIVSDLTGSPAEMVDPAGQVAWHRGTTVWGLPFAVLGADGACPFGFPGQYHDAETGLAYNHHRYYDPATARYQSPDVLGLGPQPNPYAYTRNPVTLIDPLGLAPYRIGDVDSLVGKMDDQTYFHYTNEESLKSIMSNDREATFAANSRGKVFFTQEMLNPQEVETQIFIGNPLYAGKGDYMVAFQWPEGAVMRPGEQPNEVIHQGTLRVPRGSVLYSGENPF